MTSDDAYQLARQIPKAGNLGLAMVGSWDSRDPVCLGIAELSRHGMAKRGDASYPVSAPHAPTLNILCRTRASRGFSHAIFAAVVGTLETKSNGPRPRVFT